MIQMILAFINTFQILNILKIFNEFEILNLKLLAISKKKNKKKLKVHYNIIEDLMNTNEADQTYSLISRTNSDNLMRFSLFSFLQ